MESTVTMTVLAQSVRFFIGMLNSFGGAALVVLGLAVFSTVTTGPLPGGAGAELRADGSTEPRMSATVGRAIFIELLADLLGC